jgi:hypothetical protein
MNSIFHIPSSLMIVPDIVDLPTGTYPVPNQYTLYVTYKPEKPALRFRGVHIPRHLVAELQEPTLRGFHMLSLDLGSREQLALAAMVEGEAIDPAYLVVGTKLYGGRVTSEVPAAWIRYRRNDLLLGGLLLALAAGLLSLNANVAFNTVAAGLCAIGALSLGRAKRVHTKPFWVRQRWEK